MQNASERSRYWGEEIDALAVLSPMEFAEYQTLISELEMEEERELCQDSLLEFFKHCWPHMGESAELNINWHHEAMIEHLEAIARGELRNLVINIPPRHPLCDETLVQMADGTRKKLGKIVVGDEVITKTGGSATVTELHPQGLLPGLKIITHSGHVVIADETHPFLTPEGMVPAGELAPGQCLALRGPRELHPHEQYSTGDGRLFNMSHRDEEFLLAGYFIGDGSVTHNSSNITSATPENIDQICSAAAVLGFTTNLIRQKSETAELYKIEVGGGARRWLRQIEIAELNSYTKHVPKFVFEGTDEQVAVYLAAYFHCDGTVGKKGANRRNLIVSFSSVSERLLRDTQSLLLRLGIYSRLRRRVTASDNAITKKGYVYWVLDLTRETDAAKFFSRLPLIGPKRQRLTEWCSFAQSFHDDLIPDPIVSIEHCGEYPMRCITVSRDASFIAHDIVVSNSKSLISNVAFPAWLWVQERDPEYPLMGPHVRFLSVSFAAHLAERFGLKMLNLVQSEWYQKLWGHQVRIRSDQQSRAAFANTKGGERLSASVEAGLLGRGADIILADDVHDVEGAESQIQREATVRAFSESLSTRVTDPRIAARVLIMQRLHEDDATSWALEHWPRATTKHLMFPARFDPNFACEEDQRTSPGEPLWPELWNDQQLAQMEVQIGPYSWAGQYCQTPSPREGGIIEIRDWNVYPEEPPEPNAVRRTPDGQIMLELPEVSYVILSLDTAMSEEETSAWNACIAWGVWHRRRNQVSNIVGTERPWFSQRWSSAPLSESEIRQQIIEDDDQPRAIMMEAWRRRCKLNDPSLDQTGRPQGLVQRVIETARRRHADKIVIEDKTRARDVRDEIIRQMGSEAFQIELWNPQRHGDKVARLYATQPLFSQKLIYAPGNYEVVTDVNGNQHCEVREELKWVAAVIHEMAQVPRGKWDDLADAASMGLLWLRANGFLELTRQHMERAMRERLWQPSKSSIGQDYGV